jgi:hypothetical protein
VPEASRPEPPLASAVYDKAGLPAIRASISQFMCFGINRKPVSQRAMANAETAYSIPCLWINTLDMVRETFYSAADRVFRY